MNSALKPVLASAGVPQPGGQSSPAKGNVASVNHASVGLPQGAQNSLNHGANGSNLAVQNLTAHAPAPQAAPHDRAVPSMAPVSANMAQMAHNMSNHGNLSQGVPAAPPPTASPSKPPGPCAPLSLVADKASQPAPSQPLALTRPTEKSEKKEPDSTAQSNGTMDSPKPAASAPVSLKPQNPEAKDKPDIAKTSPSTTKPPEKPQPTLQKPDSANQAQATPTEVPNVPTSKAAAVNELSDKSPKPAEPKPTPTADVAPTQSDSKPSPESANSEPCAPEKQKEKDKPPTPAKLDPLAQPKQELAKPENKEEEKPSTEEKPREPESKAPEVPKKDPLKDDVIDAPAKPTEKEKPEPKKVEPKKEKPKSTMKLATVTPPLRKRRQASPAKGDGPSPAKKAADVDSTPDARIKRNRTKVQLYQSPTPELAMATKLSASAGRATPTKPNDDKLIVFYKNEYLAVRNAEGGFYVCQTMQNVYRTTRKIKIRWLSQDKQTDPSGETYKPDFYDVTDMECVLTTLSLSRAAGGGGSQILRATEQARATSILQRALRAESSPGNLQLTPEHPDGLDLSLYTDESQIEKRARKRAASKSSPRNKGDAQSDTAEETTPVKKARTVPKRSPKSVQKPKPTPPPPKPNNNKRKTAGSTPLVASTSKTATAVVEKGKPAPKVMPKRSPVKQAKKPEPPPVVTPLRKGRRSAAKDVKPSPAAQPSPSTSTGKAGRRKPPIRK